MNQRLRQIIDLKTSGNQAEFAALMGWSPQYLNRLLRGENGSGIGIRPVLALVEKFPELNARWLLLGEEPMLMPGIDDVKQHHFRLLAFEKYIPFMTPDEQNRFIVEGHTDFTPETIERWQQMLDERNNFINAAIQRSAKCKTPTAK